MNIIKRKKSQYLSLQRYFLSVQLPRIPPGNTNSSIHMNKTRSCRLATIIVWYPHSVPLSG